MWIGLTEYQESIKSHLVKAKIDEIALGDEQKTVVTFPESFTLFALDLMIIKKALMDAIITFNLIHLPYEEAMRDDLENHLIFNQHKDFMVLQSYSFLAQIDNIETLKGHEDIFESMLQSISFDFFGNWVERVVIHELLPHAHCVINSPFWILSSEEVGQETDYSEEYLATNQM